MNQHLTTAIDILKQFVDEYDECTNNHDGEFPLDGPDTGCPDCTLNTVPNEANTGRCAYHSAKAFIESYEAQS